MKRGPQGSLFLILGVRNKVIFSEIFLNISLFLFSHGIISLFEKFYRRSTS